MKAYHDFGPVYDKSSRVLVLGSFPSVKSRNDGFYYAHPSNRFWPLISGLLGRECPSGTDEKRAMLLREHIALWDVVSSCEVTGSSDSSIRDISLNDISTILLAADIRLIAANGRKAYSLYERYIMPETGREAIYLPSTSPANAAWTMERLRDEWKKLLPFLRDTGSGKLTFEKVYELVRMVPRGRVTTYGHIAMALGSIRWARAVGYALHANPDENLTPCYRVVNKAGRVSDAFVFGGRNMQIEKLRADSIPVSDDGYVQDLEKYIYRFPQ